MSHLRIDGRKDLVKVGHLAYSDTVAVIGGASNCEVHSPSLTCVAIAIEHGGRFSVTNTVTL
jgi:hypothetical protein